MDYENNNQLVTDSFSPIKELPILMVTRVSLSNEIPSI